MLSYNFFYRSLLAKEVVKFKYNFHKDAVRKICLIIILSLTIASFQRKEKNVLVMFCPAQKAVIKKS